VKLKQVLLARSFRQVAVAGSGEPRVDFVKRLKDKYEFLKVPEKLEEFATNPIQAQLTGISFHEGKFKIGNRYVGIALLQIRPGIIAVDTHTSTDDADLIIDDFVADARANSPESVTPLGPPLYVDQVEFSMERVPPIPQEYGSAAAVIDRYLADYGLTVPKYSFWSMALNLDPHGLGQIQPPYFSIERRAGFPFSAKMFFSQAPLRTKEHLALLEQLDSTLH
jgi:hypothetical protein